MLWLIEKAWINKALMIATVVLAALGAQRTAQATELLLHPEKILQTRSGAVPQAPRISPAGTELVFEYYSKDRTALWYAGAEGKNARCLTCEGSLAQLDLENGFWHPSGNYIIFNQVPEGNTRQNNIYAAKIEQGGLKDHLIVAQGARPQFSRPNGTVIFFETTETDSSGRYVSRIDNVLAYRIIGTDPVHPVQAASLKLRGPIEQVNRSAEISHPSLAPDGTTIVFAARSTGVRVDNGIVLNDIDRQKIYKLWQGLIKLPRSKVDQELARLSKYNRQAAEEDYEGDFDDSPRARASVNMSYPASNAFEYIMRDEALLAEQTILPGFTKKHFYFAYVLGLLNNLDSSYDMKVQELIFPRLWTTDVFGAPIIPLVKDISSTPLPQKWPTVSHDGKFVVFEAGLYSNRHIYLVAKKKDQWLDKAKKYAGVKRGEAWMDKAIKITEQGTYNSSPEIDPTGQWLYFESNRDGTKAIWRAKLNWPEINKRLGL